MREAHRHSVLNDVRLSTNLTRGLRLACCVMVLMVLSPVAAEEPAGHPATEEATAIVEASPTAKPAAAAPEASPQAASAGGAHTEDVEPLDAWVINKGARGNGDEKAPATPTPHSNGGAAVISDTDVEDTEYEEPYETPEQVNLQSAETEDAPTSDPGIDPIEVAQRPKRTKLKPAIVKRLEALRKIQRRVVRHQVAEFAGPKDADPRGEPELRVCSVNVNGYAPREAFKSIFKAAKLPLRTKIEKSLLRQIAKAGCTVVGLQGVLAVNDASGIEGLERLAKKLSTNGATWNGYLGESVRDTIRNGFLVRTDAVTVERVETVRTLQFERFASFQLDQMKRLPLKLTVTVPGKKLPSGKHHAGISMSPDRTVVLLNAQLRNLFSYTEKERETDRMQMAHAVRQVYRAIRKEDEEADEGPIAMLLLDRQEPGFRLASRVIDGSVRLLDFTQNNGACTITETETIECPKPIRRGMDLVGLVGDGLGVDWKRIQRKVEEKMKTLLVKPSVEAQRKEREKKLAAFSEIYVSSNALSPVLVHGDDSGRYQAGTLRVATGLPNNPLIWVELNW